MFNLRIKALLSQHMPCGWSDLPEDMDSALFKLHLFNITFLETTNSSAIVCLLQTCCHVSESFVLHFVIQTPYIPNKNMIKYNKHIYIKIHLFHIIIDEIKCKNVCQVLVFIFGKGAPKSSMNPVRLCLHQCQCNKNPHSKPIEAIFSPLSQHLKAPMSRRLEEVNHIEDDPGCVQLFALCSLRVQLQHHTAGPATTFNPYVHSSYSSNRPSYIAFI